MHTRAGIAGRDAHHCTLLWLHGRWGESANAGGVWTVNPRGDVGLHWRLGDLESQMETELAGKSGGQSVNAGGTGFREAANCRYASLLSRKATEVPLTTCTHYAEILIVN